MSDLKIDSDELLLMRLLEGRLTGAETATLRERLAAEPALAAKLAALEIENELIGQAVSVPGDVELPEPVMMAIIDQAMKDPKRKPAERRWWKPVTLSLGAAAAVVVAVLTSFFIHMEDHGRLTVALVEPNHDAVIETKLNPGGQAQAAVMLARGSEILPDSELASAGGSASLSMLEGLTLHFDSNTRVKFLAMEPGKRASFELLSGALIVESRATPGRLAPLAATVRTADGRAVVSLERGQVLILPVGAGRDGSARYLIYMSDGAGTLTEAADHGEGANTVQASGALPVQQSLSDGTQVLWPAASDGGLAPVRTVSRDSLVCDLIGGWQTEQLHAPGRWWNRELRYDGLDQAWPLEWAEEIAKAANAPNFLLQAQALSDTFDADGHLVNDPARNADILQRWLAMSGTLQDNLLRAQLDSARSLTWELLTVKANLLACRAAGDAGNPAALEQPQRRLNAALRSLTAQAAAEPDNLRLQTALAYLQMEGDFLNASPQRAVDEAARDRAFIQQFPSSLECMALELRLAQLEPAGDARMQQLNLAWQYCHAFDVRMRDRWKDLPNAHVRLYQIEAAILKNLALELYARHKPAQADEVLCSFDFLNLGPQVGDDRSALDRSFHDLLVTQAADRANAATAAGNLEGAAAELLGHLPAALHAMLPAGEARPTTTYTASHSAAECWAEAYCTWLTAEHDMAGVALFAGRARDYLPAAAAPAAPVPPSAPAPAPTPAAPASALAP
ncbi:MAG: hypothetical protein ACREJ2_10330 [Planctomycetota bacterium]